MDCDNQEIEATKTIGNETNIEKHIQNLKDYIRIDKDNINYDDSDFAQFCKSHCEDIQAVLKELEFANNKINELENADLAIIYTTGFYDGENKWKYKIQEIVDECIPKKENIFTGELEYTTNANANSFLAQEILNLLKE